MVIDFPNGKLEDMTKIHDNGIGNAEVMDHF